MPLLMLHENDEAAGGCPFSRFFETTPQDLIGGALALTLALTVTLTPAVTVTLTVTLTRTPNP